MPAFGFRREFSAADHVDAARSLEAQGVAIAGVCALHRLELVAVYTERPDVDGRGESEVGPSQWHALLSDARAAAAVPRKPGSEAHTIVIPSLRILGERTFDRLLRGLQLRALGLPVLLASGDDIDRAMRAEWEERGPGDRHAERVRAGMQRRAVRGLALGRPPYGYRVIERRLAIEPTEAELVREIVHHYLDGDLGVRRIAALLNDRGLATRQGRPWSATAIRDILRNPVYLGTYRRLGVIVPHAHEPLLERRRFEEIQARMSRRRTAPAEQHRHEYLLSGLASCGYCGNRLIGVRRPGSDGELIYYQCESATNQGRCGYHTRRADELEREVRAQFAAVAPGALAPRPSEDEHHELETRRRGLRRQIEHALGAWANGEWTPAHLLAEAGPRALADLELEAALEKLRARPARVAGDDGGATDAQRLVEDWDALEFAERRSLLRRLVAEIVVTDSDVRLALAT